MNDITKRQYGMFSQYWKKHAINLIPHSIKSGALALLVLVITILIIKHFYEPAEASKQIDSSYINYVTAVLVTIFYLLFHVIFIAPIEAYDEIKSLGFWRDNVFHYNDGHLIFTDVFEDKGEEIVEIEFPVETKDALVEIKTINSAPSRVKAGFSCMKQGDEWVVPTNAQTGESKCSIRLNGNKQGLIVLSPEGTIPTKVKVYIESFHVGK